MTQPIKTPEESLFCLIMDLFTALYPEPSDHHTIRSEAIARLRRARRDGWAGLTATLGASTASPDALKAPFGSEVAPPTRRGSVASSVGVLVEIAKWGGGPEGYEGDTIGGGDFIPHARIPERY